MIFYFTGTGNSRWVAEALGTAFDEPLVSIADALNEKAKEDTRRAGFSRMYLSTEHVGYYEKYGFRYIGQGYHPWGENSRIYEIEV